MKNKNYLKADWGSIKIIAGVALAGAALIFGLTLDFYFGTFETKEARAQEVEAQGVMEYIIRETKEAGMNVDDVVKVLAYESRFNPEFMLPNNDKVKSVDRGIWAINSYHHKEVSNACAYSVSCSTKEAIRIWKEKGWGEWLGAKHVGVK